MNDEIMIDVNKRCLTCVHRDNTKEQMPCRQCYDYDKWERLFSRGEIVKEIYRVLGSGLDPKDFAFKTEFYLSITKHLEATFKDIPGTSGWWEQPDHAALHARWVGQHIHRRCSVLRRSRP